MAASGMRFAEKLAGAPWLCSPEHLAFLHGIYLRYLDRASSGQPLDRQAVEQTIGRPLDNAREVTVKEGVARIPVVGTIVRRANLFTEISGGVSTGALARDFAAAYDDASVHSILFVFDSPGGEASRINELAGAIKEKRDLGEKRIEAYCDGSCASGAYWLASATHRITADATSALGSIGVVTTVTNPEAAGKRTTLEFTNARSPKKRVDPNSETGREAIQGYVDDLGDEFIGFVAAARGVPFSKVEQDFGQGFVMIGRRAVAAGMVDELGSEEGANARLRREHASGPAPVRRAGAAGASYAAPPRSHAPTTTGDVPRTISRKESPVEATQKLQTRAAVNAAIGAKAEEIRKRDGVGPGAARMRAWQESPDLADRYQELPPDPPTSPAPAARGGAAMRTATARAEELMRTHPGRHKGIASARLEVYGTDPELAERVRSEQA